jgi:hypothetical protein
MVLVACISTPDQHEQWLSPLFAVDARLLREAAVEHGKRLLLQEAVALIEGLLLVADHSMVALHSIARRLLREADVECGERLLLQEAVACC